MLYSVCLRILRDPERRPGDQYSAHVLVLMRKMRALAGGTLDKMTDKVSEIGLPAAPPRGAKLFFWLYSRNSGMRKSTH